MPQADTVAAVRQKLSEAMGLAPDAPSPITDEALAQFPQSLQAIDAATPDWQAALDAAAYAAAETVAALQAQQASNDLAQRQAAQTQLEAVLPTLKAGLAALEAQHKAWLKLLEQAEKTLRARQWPGYVGEAARDAKKALLPRDPKKREQPTVRDRSVETFKRASYFVQHGHWLHRRFPEGVYIDVPGLCKVVTRQEIADNDGSLTPGRYVGAAVGRQDDDAGEAFVARMREIHSELNDLNLEAVSLAKRVQDSLTEWAE
jgi:type I restriction enzyme M protein